MASVAFLNKLQQVIQFSDTEDLLECTRTQEITTNKSELMNDNLTLSIKYHRAIVDAEYIAINDVGADGFSLFRVRETQEVDEVINYTAVSFAVDELDNFIVKDIRPGGKTYITTILSLLEDSECDWELGRCEPSSLISITFYYESVKEALKKIQELNSGCEFTFSVEITGNKITKKVINCLGQIGSETGKRFEYGEDALKVVRKQDRSNVITAIIGRGKGEEVGDGYGRRLEFTDVVWSKANLKPLNKPAGQNYLEYPEMTAQYGIPSNGKMLPRKTVVIYEDIEDPEMLLKKTYETLMYYSRPLVQFSTEVLGADAIGNYVSIHRGDRNYHYKTRVFKVVRDYVTGKVESGLGDNLSSMSLNRQVSNVQSNISDIYENKMTFYDSTEISKWQSDIIRGAKGGSILLMNPEDTGVGTGREPYQMVWMNGASLDESDHFLVANSEGIGFIDGKWNEANFKTAWTIAGVFNADYIQAGTIQGIDLISLNQNYKVIITDGSIQFKNTKTGVRLGTLFSADVTLGSSQSTGLYIIQENGYPFGVMAKKSDESITEHFVVQPDGFGGVESNKSVVRLNADQVQVASSLWVTGKIYLNGKELTSGGTGGGGGWNGKYPSEITTQAEQFAWQAWITLLNLGYSKSAAAGILGNIRGEVGAGMNPDTDQIGGPAYGAIQFDGSAYPLIGSPTNNGREYFQRLHNASGVGGDYREMPTQMKVVDWSMTNGQWIGAVSPTSVDGFKNINSPETAAYAFEKNFERPAADHSERQGWAREWYNKFESLQQPGGTGGYALPVREGTPVTSWFGPRWGTMHNGIDFGAPSGDPIFASKDGTVVQSMPTSASGGFGEYIIVQHDDGYMTGYAHMTTRMKQVGDIVSQGQQIGTIGSTGDSTGPHLHFSIQTGTWGPYTDPAPFLGLTPP